MSLKTMLTCLKCSPVAVFLLFFQISYCQPDPASLDKVIKEKAKVLGQDLVVIITKNDSTFYQFVKGDFNPATQAPIASCSKWLTAALMLQLVDEGKISLDDKVSKYLPVFESYGKSYITIRHCLSHMTGISSEPLRLRSLLERKKFTSLQEEVESFAKKEIAANPGEQFSYSNIGLNIAGRIAEVVTKKKFDLLIRQKLFLPLEMRKTSFSTKDGSAPNPSGGAVSTAADYTKFLQMILNEGQYNGKQVLSKESIRELRMQQNSLQQVKYAPSSAEGFTYALGAWVLEAKGKEATVLASPGLFGTWPMVDFCRGYTCIFFVKNYLGEQKADIYLELKKMIDQQFSSTCK